MKPGRSRQVPLRAALIGLLALPGCLPGARIDSASDPLVVAASGSSAGAQRSPERAAAVADMRRQAAAGDSMPYPDVFQSEQTARLAAREEPRPVSEAEAIQAELEAIATMRRAGLSAAESAEMDARERDLRKLALLRQNASPQP